MRSETKDALSLSLPKTASALKRLDAAPDFVGNNAGHREVTEAFAEETADRNDPETVRAFVAVGPRHPTGGFPLSFLRRMVQKYGGYR